MVREKSTLVITRNTFTFQEQGQLVGDNGFKNFPSHQIERDGAIVIEVEGVPNFE